jgi:hypothetical protein
VALTRAQLDELYTVLVQKQQSPSWALSALASALIDLDIAVNKLRAQLERAEQLAGRAFTEPAS